jgi:hypothetical protein
MHGWKVHDNAWMLSSPLPHFLPMMCTDMIAHQMNRPDVLVNCDIYRVEKGHAFPLPLPFITVPVDLASTGVKGGNELARARPLVRMRQAVRPVVGLGWPGRGRSGPRLEGGLLSDGEHQLIRLQGTGVEVNQLGDGRRESGVPRVLGVQPQMMAPGLQRMRGQKPSDGGSGDVRHHARRAELARQFGAIPRGEATTQQLRAFAGEAHHVDRDLRGKNRPWPRGQERLKDRPDAGQEHAWPSGGPPSVAHQRPAPPRSGRPLLPGAG